MNNIWRFLPFLILNLVLFICYIQLPQRQNTHLEEKQNTNDVVYRFQDTIEFCDKNSNKVLTKLENVEFRILSNQNIMYVVYDRDKGVVILDQLSENIYVNIYRQVDKNE